MGDTCSLHVADEARVAVAVPARVRDASVTMPGTGTRDEGTWRVEPLAERDAEAVIAAGLGLARHPSATGFYLVAWEGSDALGHAHLALGDPPELQDVEVRPAHRRRGVGGALSAAAEHEAERRGHDRIRLTVSVENAAAQALYRSCGYVDSPIPPKRIQGTVRIRSGLLEFDDTLLTWDKALRPYAVLLHGAPGLPDYLDELATELESVFRPLRHTRHADRPFDAAAYAAGVDAEIARAGAERAWLVGHSSAAHLALHAAAAYPERVAGVVSIGGTEADGDGATRTRALKASAPPELPVLFVPDLAPWRERPGAVRDAVVDFRASRSS